MSLLLVCSLVAAAATLFPTLAAAQSPLSGVVFHISRASGPIHIDGDLSDEAWRTATRIEKWYEVTPGDNIEPPVKSVGYLTYDDRFLYAAFEFEDPEPDKIRAPFGDHDNINGNSMDFGGIFIDPLNTRRTALEFFVTPSNVQYDAVTDDASGENASPDFFWESAARINGHGWTVEMRIPFSTLRYSSAEVQHWGIMLFRNYPRAFRRQILSAPIPRGSNCTICRENSLEGLDHLPGGGHIVAAPYLSGSETQHPRGDQLGQPLTSDPAAAHAGLDVKFTPTANAAIDVTIKPDFSQVESDTAQISANERFALFFPEKRPFFLEGVDLLQTPIQAVYTRTITSPTWGARVTGKEAGFRYTALVTEDSGGGSVVLPGANGSSTAPQDVASTVFIGRAKRDIGLSSVGVLVADREATTGDSHNRVVGPDFQWRPSASDVFAGQWLYSETRTPDRPDLADEWNGQQLSGTALQASWSHNTRHLDLSAKFNDVGSGFRADTGFVPQVGYREGYASAGWTVHQGGLISIARPFVTIDYQTEPSGAVITRDVEPSINLNTAWNGFVQFRYIDNRTRAGSAVIERHQFSPYLQFSPSRRISYISLSATLGQDIDFDNARPAHGTTINSELTVQPTDHLALDLIENIRWLNETGPSLVDARLFTQQVSRLKGTYTFTSRLFVRVIGQYVATTNDPSLFITAVDARSGDFSGSALLAYKLNWQSVMFVGYGDDRELSDDRRLQPLDRQLFVKLSYAFQR
jgi:hypothetical protein